MKYSMFYSTFLLVNSYCLKQIKFPTYLPSGSKHNFKRSVTILNSKNIILRRSKKIFSQENLNSFLNETDYKNKSIIRLEPGGLYGFYNFGTCVYMKDKYNLDNYIFTGASAGAWNSALLSYKHDINYLSSLIMKNIKHDDKKSESIFNTQMQIKDIVMNNFKSSDFNMKKVFIGTTIIENSSIYTNIYSDFINLEDMLDCCIASSNIPFITGKCDYKYDNKSVYDGGFSINPYLEGKHDIVIHPGMWGKTHQDSVYMIFKKNNNIHDYYTQGYNDAKKNMYKIII
jgi:hypothetical protein